MLKISTIIVPVDFSDRCKAAAEHAAHLATHFDSRLVFTHVMLPLPLVNLAYASGYHYGWIEPEMDVKRRESFQKQLDALAEETSLGRPYETAVLEGDIAHQIEQMAQQKHGDLLVIPTHGRGPFRRFVLGSVTTKMLHDISCPIFTGRHVPELPPFDVEPYRRVACAISLRERDQALAILRWATGFAQVHDAKLSVIHVTPHGEFYGAYEAMLTPDYWERVAAFAQGEVETLVREAGGHADIDIVDGGIVRNVPEEVKKLDVDVLVIGRGVEKGVFGRLRTHAYGLIRESPCPVISV